VILRGGLAQAFRLGKKEAVGVSFRNSSFLPGITNFAPGGGGGKSKGGKKKSSGSEAGGVKVEGNGKEFLAGAFRYEPGRIRG